MAEEYSKIHIFHTYFAIPIHYTNPLSVDNGLTFGWAYFRWDFLFGNLVGLLSGGLTIWWAYLRDFTVMYVAATYKAYTSKLGVERYTIFLTIRYDTILQYKPTLRYDTIRYVFLRYDTIRYDTIFSYDTIRYDIFLTIRYDLSLIHI